MSYSSDYNELLKRLNAGKRVKIRFTWNHFLPKKETFVDKVHYGEMYEDDWRYFITSEKAGISHFEPCFSRNKYTANLHKYFNDYKIEFKI